MARADMGAKKTSSAFVGDVGVRLRRDHVLGLFFLVDATGNSQKFGLQGEEGVNDFRVKMLAPAFYNEGLRRFVG